MKKLIILVLLLLFANQAYSLSISGELKVIQDFAPGAVRENSYVVRNAEGYPVDYEFVAERQKGADLTPYFEIEPNRVENVPDGGSANFKVRFTLPDRLNESGESETWLRVRIDTTSSGVIRAVPSVAIRYIVFVLYPYPFIASSFSAPDMNINETSTFSVSIENRGEPEIQSSYADIELISEETNEVIAKLRTDTVRNLKSKEKRSMSTTFSSKDRTPGNYKARFILHWDGNTTEGVRPFRIGNKEVKIIDYTRIFEADSINKMDISLESAWNTKITNMYVSGQLYDGEQKVKDFKSVSADLDPWERKSVEAYVDTKGLEAKTYRMIMTAFYEGASTTVEGTANISKATSAVVVEEIPGQFKLQFPEINMMNIMIFLLFLFVLVNLYLVFTLVKSKKKQKIDPAVLESVKALKEKYNDAYIKDTMMKKGWSEEAIDQILRELK